MSVRFELAPGVVVDVPPEVNAEGGAALEKFYAAAVAHFKQTKKAPPSDFGATTDKE